MTHFKHPFENFLLPLVKWSLAAAMVLLVIFVVGINVFSGLFVGKEHAIRSFFDDMRVSMSINHVDWNDCRLRYIQTGLAGDSADLLFFIHGAPGNLDNFKEYLADEDLLKRFKMVSMDRPGYGQSCPEKSVVDISVQADAAARILKSINYRHAFIISHSYGTAVAGKLAADYPGLCSGIVMCAPLNDPESEPMRWFSVMADWKISRWLMPGFVETATDEKMSHARELERIKNSWRTINVPVLHIHGEDDGLAPFEPNIRFSRDNIRNELLDIYTEKEMGHLNIWINAGTVKQEILEFIDTASNN